MLRWFARRLEDAKKEEKGFTLIELLVVIIIIAVLAAIAIPTFLAQRERAWEASARSDLRNAAAAATSCSSANDGSYVGCGTIAELSAFGWNKTALVTYANDQADAAGWAGNTTHSLDDGTTFRFDTDAAALDQRGQVYCDAATNAATGGADC